MYIFGIDVGGTDIKIGIFTSKIELIFKWSIPTNKDSIFKDIATSINEYLMDKKILYKNVIGYGIGIPGLVNNNIAIKCVNLNWKNVNVIEEFQKAIGYDAKVVVANDANLAAYGEYALHNGKYNTLILMTLGTGVGGGVITNGQIVEGANGLSGEIGHIRIETEHKFLCSCGKTGCLETVSSATGILRLANHYAFKEQNIRNKYLSAKEVIEKAKENDKIAYKVFDYACHNIAKTFALLSVTINPDVFIIGGGVSNAGDFLLNKIKDYYRLECFEDVQNVDIKLSTLRNDAGIYGGASLILKKEFIENGEC